MRENERKKKKSNGRMKARADAGSPRGLYHVCGGWAGWFSPRGEE